MSDQPKPVTVAIEEGLVIVRNEAGEVVGHAPVKSRRSVAAMLQRLVEEGYEESRTVRLLAE